MMTDKPWKLVLLLTGIFIAGVVAGAFGAVRLAKEFTAKRAMPEQWALTKLKFLTERLELTPAQVEQLRPIIKRDSQELTRIREGSMKETQVIFQRMEGDIAATLTPEQKVKFEELNKELRERMKKIMKDRRPGDPGRPGPGPGRPPGDGPGAEPPPPPDKPPGGDEC